MCLGTNMYLVLSCFDGIVFLLVLVSQILLLRFSYNLSAKLKTLDVFWGLQKGCLFGWLGCWTWLERTIMTFVKVTTLGKAHNFILVTFCKGLNFGPNPVTFLNNTQLFAVKTAPYLSSSLTDWLTHGSDLWWGRGIGHN